MDIGAYAQIEDLEVIAKENGIEVPRLRGLCLMSELEPVDANIDVEEMVTDAERWVIENFPRFWSTSPKSETSAAVDRLKKKYLIIETVTGIIIDGKEYSCDKVAGFRWNLVHGKRRKALKFAVKKTRRAATKQYETFKKYVGRDDVLCLHAKLGGGNWAYFGGADIARQPWFIEKVDDCFDSTYCDIYAKLSNAEFYN